VTRRTKNQKLAPKIFPDMMPGQIEARFKKCGRAGCKCSRGELHGPYFYHRTWLGERHRRRFVRLANVAEARAACEEYRALQAQLRKGRAEWRATLARARELFSFLAGAERAGWL
jgi:hypothetical protein